MIKSFDGKTPQIAASAFISEAAYVVGDVTIGERSSVWPGAVIRADYGAVVIGAETHIEDNATLHLSGEIGSNVTVGHNAVLHGKRIGDATLIGNSATVLDGVEIGSHCVVAAGAVVRPGTVVPDYSLVVGVPAEVRPLPDNLLKSTLSFNEAYGPLVARYRDSDLHDSGR